MDKLDVEDQEEYREAFALFDKNKDGRINGKELSELMRYLGVGIKVPHWDSTILLPRKHSSRLLLSFHS